MATTRAPASVRAPARAHEDGDVHPCDAVSSGRARRPRRGLIEPVDRSALTPRLRSRRAQTRRIGVDDVPRPCRHARAVELALRAKWKACEGEPAHRRADGRGRQERAAHRPPHEPLFRDAVARLPAAIHHHRRGAQHRPHAAGQGRHHSQRGRPGPRLRRGAAARRHPRRRRDDQPEHACDAGCGGVCKMADRGQIAGAVLAARSPSTTLCRGRRPHQGPSRWRERDILVVPTRAANA